MKEKQKRQSHPRVDLTGKQFGYLTPLYYIKGGKWHCRCKCGNEIDVDTRNLNSGHTKSCGCLLKEHNKQYITDMTEYENDGIKVIKYAGSDNQGVALWECECKHCGRSFVTRGSSIRQGLIHSCGCVHSTNEIKIIKILQENNIEYATQYVFPDLVGVNGGHLRFDFAIFKEGKLQHLIEFNGMQHYERPKGTWADEYDDLIENDKRKKQYCKDHNIELRIIKYNESYSLDDLI